MFRTSRGFSLLELLVVVTIIAVFVGAAVLSIGIVGDDRDLEQEAFRIKSLFDLVHEEAVMQNRDFGVLFSDSGYRFYIYDHQEQLWLTPAGDTLLQERSLPPQINLALSVEDRDVALDENFDVDERDTPSPQVMILSTGEVTPFSAELYRPFDESRVSLRAELDGNIEIIADDGFSP